jgi:hypothetical protein
MSMSWNPVVELWLILAGVVAVIVGLAKIYDRYFGESVAEPEPQQPPKPRGYRVRIEDADGWPYASYCVSPKEAGRVMRELDRIKYD